MRLRNFVILLLAVLSCTAFVYAKDNTREVWLNNVSLRISEGWTLHTETMEKNDFVLRLSKDNSENFVEVVCVSRVFDESVRVNDIASKRSLQDHFDYMQIDEIESVVFKKFNAKLLGYTNIYLNEVSKGGIYCFLFEGYTYTVEFFGKDNPKETKELKKIVDSFKIVSAKKERNIVEKDEDYRHKDWKKFDDTTSLQTKVEELGEDLRMINTADNHKKVSSYSEKEFKIREKLQNLQEKRKSIEEEIESLEQEGNEKALKKKRSELKKIDKQTEPLKKELSEIVEKGLKVQLKEKKK